MSDEITEVKGLMSGEADKEHAYMMSRGIRPMAIVGTVSKICQIWLMFMPNWMQSHHVVRDTERAMASFPSTPRIASV